MSTTAQHITSQMKLIFSEYGWPETIISNNGPCHSAKAFTKLMQDHSVNHITSSPIICKQVAYQKGMCK